MKMNPTGAAPNAKTEFYAEGLGLLEIFGAGAHSAILDELERLDEPGSQAQISAGLCPLPEWAPEPQEADPELDGAPLAGGPLGHDADAAGWWLPPVAYSSAVWEDLRAEAAP